MFFNGYTILSYCVIEVSDMRKTLSFFSGCMGLDLGLEQAGFDIIFVCEKEKHAVNTIKANRPNIKHHDDITTLDRDKIYKLCNLSSGDKIDLVCGGPPCQSYTTVGLRKGVHDPRGNLLLTYIDLAIGINPEYIVMENVRGILSSKIGDTSVISFVQRKLEDNGYKSSYGLYDAVNFGVPQKRERVILIACKHSEPNLLTPTHSNDQKYGLPKWVTLREAISDVRHSADRDYHQISDVNWKFFEHIKPGENWKSLPLEMQKLAMKGAFNSSGGRTGFFKKLSWDDPCVTLTCNPMHRATPLVHPEHKRYLSISEYKRIQTFPDDWIICGGLDARYKQLGNAVPVKFSKCIGESIIMHQQGQKLDEKFKDFKYSRFKKQF